MGGGQYDARKIKRAQILLAADSGLSDDDIAAAVAVGGSRTKRRFVAGNLEAALNEEPRAGTNRELTSNEEALLIATAYSSPPEGLPARLRQAKKAAGLVNDITEIGETEAFADDVEEIAVRACGGVVLLPAAPLP